MIGGKTNVWLVAGAALYWAEIVVRFSLLTESVPMRVVVYGALSESIVICVFVVILWLARRVVRAEAGRTVLVLISLASSCTVALMAVPFAGGWDWSTYLSITCYGCSVAIHMVLWGFCFASLDKRAAGRNVGLTLLVTVTLSLVATAMARWIPGTWLICAMSASSSVILLSQRVYFSDRRREGRDGLRGLAVRLAGLRFSFGVFIGFALSLPHYVRAGDAMLPLIFIGLLVVTLMLVCFVRTPSRLYFMLPAVLVIGVGVIYLPFFVDGLESFADVVSAPVWLVWAALSAIQLSDYKELFSTSEIETCLVDKLSLGVSLVIGTAVGTMVESMDVVNATALRYIVLVGACMLGLAAVWQVASLVDARQEDEARDVIAASRRKRQEELYGDLAVEFGLSTREREVMEMLAEGYTSAYIKETLGISLGTAKAHASHIYQKVGVHKKDELIELIEERLGRI